MKNRIIAVLLSLLVITLFAACGTGGSISGGSSQVSAAASEKIVVGDGKDIFLDIGSATPGGMWYTMNASMTTAWQDSIKNVIPKIVPGSSTENLKGILNGSVTIGMTHTAVVSKAQNGIDPFIQKETSMRSLMAMAPGAVQILVPDKSDIDSLEDLKDKRVGFGYVGAIQNIAVMGMLQEAYGITEESIIANGGTCNYLTDGDIVTALQDGQVDVVMLLSAWPKVGLEELAVNPGIRLLQVDQKVLDDYCAAHPEWVQVTIPAGTYSSYNEDVTTLSTSILLACNENADEELIYTLVKTFWEHYDAIAAASTDIAKWTNLEDAVNDIGTCQLHAGAERYYKEIGALV